MTNSNTHRVENKRTGVHFTVTFHTKKIRKKEPAEHESGLVVEEEEDRWI